MKLSCITGLLLAPLLAVSLPAGAADSTTNLSFDKPATKSQQPLPEGSGNAEAGPPFLAALRQAAVEQSQITDVHRQALVLGNGGSARAISAATRRVTCRVLGA